MDREHHPVAEPVVGNGDPLAVNKQPRLDHLIGADALGRPAHRAAQSARARRSRAKSAAAPRVRALDRRDSRAPSRRSARADWPRRCGRPSPARRGGSRALSPARASAPLWRGIGTPAIAGQPFDRVGEAQALGLDQKREDVAVLAGRKIVEEPLLVIDEERGRLLGVEGRQARPFAPLPAQFDALADDLRHRQPGPDLVQKGGREFHGPQIGPPPGFGKPAAPLSPPFIWGVISG